MTASPTAVSPATFEMSVTEIETLNFDASPRLSTGQSVAGVVASLTRVRDGKSIALADAATTVGSTVSQIVRGSALEASCVYLLRIPFTRSPSVDVATMDLQVTATP